MSELYSQTIRELARMDRWFGKMPVERQPDAHGHNRHCGDSVSLWQSDELWYFSGEMCALCRASSHLLCNMLNVDTPFDHRQNTRQWLQDCLRWLDDMSAPVPNPELECFRVAEQFKVRTQCLALPWKTLEQVHA